MVGVQRCVRNNWLLQMNVLVLSTGRHGSTTFARACNRIQNYSAVHRSRSGGLEGRMEHPGNHIELFLKDKSRRMGCWLETAGEDFREF
jgi:hypothetical protein